MQRQRAQVAVGGDEFGVAAYLRRRQRAGGQGGCRAPAAPRSAARLPPAPASRRNRPACRPAWSTSTARSSRRGCKRGEHCDVGLALEPGHVGMAADGAGRGAGRIEQHRIERSAPAIPARRRRRFRPGAQAARIFGDAGKPRRRAVDRGHPARRHAPVARSCRRAPRTDRRRQARARRRTAAPAARRRRPAPTRRLR